MDSVQPKPLMLRSRLSGMRSSKGASDAAASDNPAGSLSEAVFFDKDHWMVLYWVLLWVRIPR